MGQFAAIGALIGTGVQAFGQLEAGREQEKAFRQRAGVLEADALVIEKAAREEGRQIRLEGRRLAGTQRVQIAGSGVNLAGTPLLVLAETRREIAKDAGFITEEGVRRGGSLRQQAGFERQQGKSARRAGRFGAATSLLTGGAAFVTRGSENNWWRRRSSIGGGRRAGRNARRAARLGG